jgi:hypothetical protein
MYPELFSFSYNAFIKPTSLMKKILILFLSFVIMPFIGRSQDVMFAGYEHRVNPAMNVAYRDAVKNLKTSCQQNKSAAVWSSFTFDDNSYIHFVPIKAFGDLDKNMFADLEGKVGKEGMGKLFTDMDKCTETQSSFICIRMTALTYNAPSQGDENFSSVLYWTPTPGKEAEAELLIAEWHKLHVNKKAQLSMVTYKMLFGGDTGYAFVSTGKNELDVATRSAKTNELFGQEAASLWARSMAITKKYDTKTGWYVGELSNVPVKPQ